MTNSDRELMRYDKPGEGDGKKIMITPFSRKLNPRHTLPTYLEEVNHTLVVFLEASPVLIRETGTWHLIERF